MAKRLNLKSIDNLDRKILKELQQNARISVSEISRRVNLSAPAVGERILKMEDEGIIKGYQVKLEYEKIGLPIEAFITFKAVSINHKDFIRLVRKLKEVQECYIVTGNPGAFLKVAVDSTKSLGELIEKLKNFGETNTSIILSKPVYLKIID